MAWKQIKEPKRPTDRDVSRGRAYWECALITAKQHLHDADSSQAAGRALERVHYCQRCLQEIGE